VSSAEDEGDSSTSCLHASILFVEATEIDDDGKDEGLAKLVLSQRFTVGRDVGLDSPMVSMAEQLYTRAPAE
jgi:hypothetical protein